MIGPLPTAREYAARAELHRPADPEAIAAEIRRLAATGLTPRDVAVALRLDVQAVHFALSASPSSAGRSPVAAFSRQPDSIDRRANLSTSVA
jgi:hypothetical protein